MNIPEKPSKILFLETRALYHAFPAHCKPLSPGGSPSGLILLQADAGIEGHGEPGGKDQKDGRGQPKQPDSHPVEGNPQDLLQAEDAQQVGGQGVKVVDPGAPAESEKSPDIADQDHRAVENQPRGKKERKAGWRRHRCCRPR